MPNIRDLDLNLLKLLKAVVETKNTHEAASRLGISQTSVSRGLAKLREVFGDQLFIRKAHGVEPSELAEKLAEASEAMYFPIEDVIKSYKNFDPNEFSGEVKIATQIYFVETYGVKLFEALRVALPKARFHFIYWQDNSLSEVLNGNIDYLIQFNAYPLPQEVYQHHLHSIKLSLIARENHPILSTTSDWEAIHELPLVRLVIDGINTKRSPVEEVFRAKGYHANISLTTHSVKVMLNQLVNSDAILFGSSYMLELQSGLACYPLPAIPKELEQVHIIGGYLQTKRGDPLNQYLHQTMQSFYDSVIQPE
ncbi:LysR family transcriptional regulator [Vibrio sp. ZSDZ34]|jgi:DNA-binding transcriptional LysR family regulator|uniref:LysR family transcriptional regulator n=1 Tax=Vibrio gelatinilyticus TaxID=2893468 RepID=A0A9X2AVJ9_9VIBR|nr:LysR family transcriptional regulator [Vibrio gelatinilyticus]MCJ2376944.1 LysR family transcriptional regulator [Vibrio gelatinilyticus]